MELHAWKWISMALFHTLSHKSVQEKMAIKVIIFLSHSLLKKSNLYIYFMNKKYRKFVELLDFLTKFRLTCIYASCKVEEFHVSAEELGKGIQQDHQVILNNEMIVLQSLGFDLIAYAPYRSVDGFLDDMEGFFQVKNSQQMFKELRDATILEIDKTMLTDAPLLFPPGQLALAALRRSNNTLNILDFDRYLHNICSQRHEHAVYEMEDSICAIESLVNEAKIPAAKDMRHIDRKLKCCWNPSLQEDSRKREKKSKHKSKRTLTEMRAPQM